MVFSDKRGTATVKTNLPYENTTSTSLPAFKHWHIMDMLICEWVRELSETAVKLYYDKLPHFNGCAYSTKYRMVRYEFDNTLEVSTNFWTSQSGFWLVHSEERSQAVSIYRASQYISLCMTSIRCLIISLFTRYNLWVDGQNNATLTVPDVISKVQICYGTGIYVYVRAR